MIHYSIYSTAIGEVCIAATDEPGEAGLVAVDFRRADGCPGPRADWERGASSLTDAAAGQLEEYLAGRRRVFELPLQLRGTAFQRRAWQALLEIPYGETRSYMQQAEAVGNPRAVRAVARANGANPLAILVPCHRVIGADGSLTGYAGGLEIKARLLTLEGARFVEQATLL
ncbi:methylated-DNA--[protein]-cysteine S-methyltransferase [Microbulbifer yueqingensis]|uniref:Methylated-DNA--protein-cysteine methyltransferase n=1 Tax=Microbulbifer yueqingensis TaxID=658219 RepID=A0A1G9E3Q2_9GAMM|nr:methylated-DNA--[protein]-cysteine S-methyltransferase [Microbulbifer yueqingensis]SDK70697.1 methylated-DNA-[protein]-cysteine S-methyltransferase [Microbulbifer yueqingensis]